MDKEFFTREELEGMPLFAVRDIARKMGVKSPTSRKKDEIIAEYVGIVNGSIIPKTPSKRGRPPKTAFVNDVYAMKPQLEYGIDRRPQPTHNEVRRSYSDEVMSIDQMLRNPDCERKCGLLDIHPEGYGFLRAENCEYGNKDTYVSAKIIRGMGLRMGDMVDGVAKKNSENKPPALIAVDRVNGRKPENLRSRPSFDNLVPIFPDERLKLETIGRSDFAIRFIDLIAPIGKGQRAMIVSPPKAGKTTLLKKIASSIAENYPDVELYVLLIDERPEEVTDMQRSIKGEVIFSTFDETPEHHCKAAELLIEKAKRNVELGKDVVIIMDSLTRLARAYNLTIPPTGRTLSGGMDPGALHNPKRFFGSARNIENGGSLTIIATALIDTGSRMDDVIYEEFKGTGNMEIHLDRKMSERRIFPAIDLNKSSTRREDLLFTQSELEGAWAIRKMLSSGDSQEATEQLINMIVKTRNNTEFLDNLRVQMKAWEKAGFSFRS